MRQLTKLAAPQLLLDNADNWTAELMAVPAGSPNFGQIQNRYKRKAIKDRLIEETHNKCAYCEGEVEGSSYLHIEHIQPKASNPDLTFIWTNLTLACAACNVKKSTIPPTNGNFIHPYNDNPVEHFHFIGSFMQWSPGDIAAQNMVNWIDLNRGGLISQRAEVLRKLVYIYDQAILLAKEARREFITLSFMPLKANEAQYSRVAICNEEVLEVSYKARLEAD